MNPRDAAHDLIWAYLQAELSLNLKDFTIEGYNAYIVQAQKAGEWYQAIDQALQQLEKVSPVPYTPPT